MREEVCLIQYVYICSSERHVLHFGVFNEVKLLCNIEAIKLDIATASPLSKHCKHFHFVFRNGVLLFAFYFEGCLKSYPLNSQHDMFQME